MVRTWVAVLVADAVMLAAVFLMLQDVQSRIDCSIPGCMSFITRTSVGFSYSILTKSFSMVVNGNTLTSPPILDWFQVLAVALVAVNGWYSYQLLVRRRTSASGPAPV